jgi:hypothetical protein
MSLYVIAIPLVLELALFVLSGDLLNIRKLFYWGYLSAVLSFLAGFWLFYFRTLDAYSYPGFILLIFSIPLIYLTCFEVFRLIYKKFRSEEPCITNLTSVIGTRPIGSIFSEYPINKVTSLADFVFSVAQCIIPLAIIFVLILLALINRW